MSRNDWPTMGPAAIVVSTVLMIGVVVTGVAQGERLIAALLDGLCTGTACQPAGLVVAGWIVVGGPLILAGLILLMSSPGVAAQYAMLACVFIMGFGASVMYGGFDEFGDAHAGSGPLGVGFYAAILALIIGGTIGGPAHLTSWERPRYSSTARLPSAVAPLLVIGACQVLALAAVLLWATVLR